MKIGVLGSGLMGKEAARDLVISNNVEAVGIADINILLAKQACDALHSSKVTAYQVDASDPQQLSHYIDRKSVV